MTKTSNVKHYVSLIIAGLFMFGFGKVVPPFAGITEIGVSMIGIFLGVLIAALATGETFWPSLFGLIAMITCEYSTAGELLATWFGNATIQQIIWVMALAGAVTESGAVNVLARKVFRIRALQGHPMRLVFAILFAALIAAALVSSPTTIILLFYPMLDGICDMCNVKKDSDLKRELLLGIYIAAMGAYILPFKGVHLSSIAIISGIMEQSGLTFNSGIYLAGSTAVIVLFVIVYIILMRFVWKTDVTPLKDFDVDKMGLKEEDFKMTGRQKVLLGFMLVGILFLIMTLFFPKGSVVFAVYAKYGSTWIWIILFAILCAMRTKEGKPYINGVKLLQSRTMWGIVAVAGCFTICGSAIASDDLGIKAAIANGLSPILGNASWPIMVILCVVAATVFTNFTNGMPISFTINAVCIPLACSMELTGSGNATVLGIATILSSMAALLTPSAIAYAPLLHEREEINNKFMFTKGAVTVVAYIVVACLICIPLGYMA